MASSEDRESLKQTEALVNALAPRLIAEGFVSIDNDGKLRARLPIAAWSRVLVRNYTVRTWHQLATVFLHLKRALEGDAQAHAERLYQGGFTGTGSGSCRITNTLRRLTNDNQKVGGSTE